MIKWVGIPELERTIDKMEKDIPRHLAKAMYQEANNIMVKSKQATPVDLGTLRASGDVAQPEVSGSNVSVTLGYGGAASAYALAVHEHPSAHSPPSWAGGVNFTVGGPKFLEGPVNAAVSGLANRLAARMP